MGNTETELSTSLLGDLVVERTALIEAQAERDKAEVDFVAKVVSQNWSQLRCVLDPDSQIPMDQLTEYLFDETLKLIRSLNREFTTVIGFRYVNKLPLEEVLVPSVQMGWEVLQPFYKDAEYREITDNGGSLKRAYALSPSEAGLTLIDEYRTTLGYVPIQEQRKLNQERFDSMIAI